MVKLFLKAFEAEAIKMIRKSRDNTINMAEYKPDYIIDLSEACGVTDLEKVNKFLRDEKILSQGNKITSREWDCLQLYTYNKSAKETGNILKISGRTVETHWASIKEKLKVNKKSQILDIIN